MPPARVSALALTFLILLADAATIIKPDGMAHMDKALQVKHLVGLISMDLKEKDGLDAALGRFDKIREAINTWEANIKAEQDERAADAAAAEGEPVIAEEDQVDFSINVTQKPARCDKISTMGSTLKIHFIGKVLKSGKMFDSSFKTGSVPVKVELGAEDTLKGWNEGLVGMCVGERRTLTVPAFMGYGSKRHGEVPPNSALQYFIELVELSGGTAAPKRALWPAMLGPMRTHAAAPSTAAAANRAAVAAPRRAARATCAVRRCARV